MEESATQPQTQPILSELLGPYAPAIEQDLQRWLVEEGTPATLAQAMRYCCLGGGKRLRPALVHMTARALGGSPGAELTARSAVAVEMIHCYSLVHDDLPSMDNDTLRRGQPTAHIQFGQAMAILAGDALLTRALGVLGEAEDPRAAALVAELAQAAGAAGMIAGQVADMKLCELPDGQAGMTYVHLRKTGALLKAAARMGAICADATAEQADGVGRFAGWLGVAFQVVDDLLDATSSASQLGKTPGKDHQAGKLSATACVGLDAAAEMARELTGKALSALDVLGPRAGELRQLARCLLGRTN